MAHIIFEKNPTLQLHQKIVTKHRKFGIRERERGNADPIIPVVCSGGCNQVHRVRASKMRTGNVFVCNDRATRDQCQRSLPRAVAGKVRVIHPQSAGKMAGVTWEDKGRLAAFKAACADVGDSFILSLTRLGMKKD
ncbi:MAG: hypothetical protein ACRC8D_08400 [Aeromonas sp.]